MMSPESSEILYPHTSCFEYACDPFTGMCGSRCQTENDCNMVMGYHCASDGYCKKAFR